MVAFLAYCLIVTLKHRLQPYAPGLTPRAVLEKLASIQMLDVSFPATDGCRLVMPRHTEPDSKQTLLLHHLKLGWPGTISGQTAPHAATSRFLQAARPRRETLFTSPRLGTRLRVHQAQNHRKAPVLRPAVQSKVLV